MLFSNHGLQFSSICALHLLSICLQLCSAYCHFSLVALSLASVTLVLALIQVLRFLFFNVICNILRSIALCALISLSIFHFIFVHVWEPYVITRRTHISNTLVFWCCASFFVFQYVSKFSKCCPSQFHSSHYFCFLIFSA